MTTLAIIGIIVFGSMLDSVSHIPIIGCGICLGWIGYVVLHRARD